MGKTVVLEMSRCIWVMDERDLKKYIPLEIQKEAIKRGKGYARFKKSYERKGNGGEDIPFHRL